MVVIKGEGEMCVRWRLLYVPWWPNFGFLCINNNSALNGNGPANMAMHAACAAGAAYARDLAQHSPHTRPV